MNQPFSYAPLKEEDYCQVESSENVDACCRTDTKYIGCLQIKVSMRSLSPENRRDIALESINRLCKRQKQSITSNSESGNLLSQLADEPNLEHSGSNVRLNITTTHLNLTLADSTSEIIVRHEMPNVSFASCGDADTSNLVAYVAKDKKFGRACFVLECNDNDNAKSVLTTIGRAFNIRSQQIINATRAWRHGSLRKDRLSGVLFTNSLKIDLIDFKSEVPTLTQNPPQSTPMTEIVANLDPDIAASIRQSVENEDWFHGCKISREQSEQLLHQDGDFLVRESILNPGQFVLTGIQDNKVHHLLLLDRNGVVRTKDRVFESIKHLLDFHYAGGLPIVSAEGALYLRNVVSNKASTRHQNDPTYL